MRYQAAQNLSFHNSVTGELDTMPAGDLVELLPVQLMTDKEFSVWDREERRMKRADRNACIVAIRWQGQMRMLTIGEDLRSRRLPRRRKP